METARGVPDEGTSSTVASEEPALQTNARAIFDRGRAQTHGDWEANNPSSAEEEELLLPFNESATEFGPSSMEDCRDVRGGQVETVRHRHSPGSTTTRWMPKETIDGPET